MPQNSLISVRYDGQYSANQACQKTDINSLPIRYFKHRHSSVSKYSVAKSPYQIDVIGNLSQKKQQKVIFKIPTLQLSSIRSILSNINFLLIQKQYKERSRLYDGILIIISMWGNLIPVLREYLTTLFINQEHTK